jgi:hypothetical protein
LLHAVEIFSEHPQYMAKELAKNCTDYATQLYELADEELRKLKLTISFYKIPVDGEK